MALDSILYYNDFILGVSTSHSGTASSMLFDGIKGEMMNVNVVHNGEIESILFQEDIMETVTLICGDGGNTYSRSRVVNK